MYYIGIDLGGMGIKAGIVSENGTIIAKDRVSTKGLDDYKEIIKEMANLSNKLMNSSGVTLEEIESVGIGIPGAVDNKTGVAYYCNNVNIKNAPLRDEFKKYIDKPVYLGNDADCAALGEFSKFLSSGVENFVAVTLGTGIGGGIIINKKLYTGFNGTAGELGHMSLDFDGRKCNCGRKGCWELYASATALMRDTEEEVNNNPDSLVAEMVRDNGGKANGLIPFEAAQKGDSTGKMLVDNYIRYLGEGLVSIINIFQPEIVAIGGGISNQGDNLLKPLKEYVLPRTYGAGLTPATEIVIASLGNDAGIIGAAFLGKN